MSWFSEVTGRDSYTQQSWRDNFNGGEAAGDWTGNHNARLDSERAAFGTTWSGSSSQPSALELAQSYVGRGNGASGAAGAVSASTGTGAGNGAVAQVAPRNSSGGNLTFTGSGAGLGFSVSGPLTGSWKETATGGWAGFNVMPNPWFSDVEEFWEPRYGEPGEWLGGIVNIAADIPFNSARAVGLNTDKLFADLANAPGRIWQGAHYDPQKLAVNPDGTDWAPFWQVNGSARLGLDGVIRKTGGGFLPENGESSQASKHGQNGPAHPGVLLKCPDPIAPRPKNARPRARAAQSDGRLWSLPATKPSTSSRGKPSGNHQVHRSCAHEYGPAFRPSDDAALGHAQYHLHGSGQDCPDCLFPCVAGRQV